MFKKMSAEQWYELELLAAKAAVYFNYTLSNRQASELKRILEEAQHNSRNLLPDLFRDIKCLLIGPSLKPNSNASDVRELIDHILTDNQKWAVDQLIYIAQQELIYPICLNFGGKPLHISKDQIVFI